MLSGLLFTYDCLHLPVSGFSLENKTWSTVWLYFQRRNSMNVKQTVFLWSFCLELIWGISHPVSQVTWEMDRVFRDAGRDLL